MSFGAWLWEPALVALAIAAAIAAIALTLHAGFRSRRAGSDFESLTPREQQILALVAEGLSNGGIAAQLGITTRAVERQVHSVFSKLELGDSELVNRRVKAALLYLADRGTRPPTTAT